MENALKFAFVCMTALAAAPAAAQQLTVNKMTINTAAIEAGRLVVTGQTMLPGTSVTLLDTGDVTKSDGRRRFAFEVVHLPEDCIVDLKAGPLHERAVVANCAPKGDTGIVASGSFQADWHNVKTYNTWSFLVLDPKHWPLEAGQKILATATFQVAAQTNPANGADTPKPRSFDYDICLRSKNGNVSGLEDFYASKTSIDHGVAVPQSIAQTLEVGETGQYQVGMCVRSLAPWGLSVSNLGGHWAAVR